jgi:DNA-binding transcriptional regulator YiaG
MSCRVRPQSKRRASAASNWSERLYKWRKRNDFSQSEAALKLRVSTRTLQEWEQGRARPRHLALGAINKLIGA